MAAVYQSVVDDRYKAAFTVPVRPVEDPEAPPIGILGLTLDLGAIAAMDIPHVCLIDFRKDYLENDDHPRRGLILHHARLQQYLAKRRSVADDDKKSPLPRADLRLLKAIQGVRLTWESRQATSDGPLDRFPDPLTGGLETYPTAFEPVIVPGDWPDDVRDTGWVVMVQVR